MDREINLDSTRALEKQVDKYERAVIQLKPTRNSLLNISTLLPPEILGTIFHWNVIPEGDFGGLPKRSYNFLLVCRHWFEVASRTPGLWSFWGNSIKDWEHRHIHHGTAPLDLALDGPGRLSNQPRDALRDRATRGAIRRICLRSPSAELLSSVISAIATKGEGTRSNSVESFKVVNHGGSFLVDISAFFSRYHLPKLRSLHLYRCQISSWGLLKSQTSALTRLVLTTNQLPPDPTLSHLLSILSSSPLLRDLALYHSPVFHAIGDDAPTIRVQLRHLEQLRLTGDFLRVSTLLNLLEIPDKMDNQTMVLYGCSPLHLSQTIGPYLGDRVRRRGAVPGGGIGLFAEHRRGSFCLRARDTSAGEADWFTEVTAVMVAQPEDREADRLGCDLIAHIPLEQVASLQTHLPILHWEELCVGMRNLTHLHLVDINLPRWFIESHAQKELLRRLNHIVITRPTLRLGRCDWTPLTDFLFNRAAIGNRISSLKLTGDHRFVDNEVVGSIERVVDVFEDEGENEYDGSDEYD